MWVDWDEYISSYSWSDGDGIFLTILTTIFRMENGKNLEMKSQCCESCKDV